ncbi:MAG: hypothetical protein QW781_05280, partial [Methanothrix sp.]
AEPDCISDEHIPEWNYSSQVDGEQKQHAKPRIPVYFGQALSALLFAIRVLLHIHGSPVLAMESIFQGDKRFEAEHDRYGFLGLLSAMTRAVAGTGTMLMNPRRSDVL